MEQKVKCPVCDSVARGIGHVLGSQKEGWELSRELVWKFQAFQENKDCSVCQSVVQDFLSDNPLCQLRHCKISVQAVGNPPRIWFYPICTTRGFNETGNIGVCPEYHKHLELIPSSLLAPMNEHFTPIDPHWIDVEQVSRWPESCNKRHAGSCHTFPEKQKVPWAKHMILIDVENYCLVRVCRPEVYVALSYVWGRIPEVLKTVKGNYDELQVPGALKDEKNIRRLPKTIQDAINLTRMMYFRYIWVDSLCIVQDDLICIQEQLSWMSSIYANSYFTIIAADGNDANYGLRGVGAGSSPRLYTPKMLEFSETCVLMSKPESETQYNLTEWHRRGWTFQERVLSPRNIVFFRNRVFWECRKSVWAEEISVEPDGAVSGFSARRYDRYSYLYRPWPDLHQYAMLVSSYNNRLLTYQADGLKAFSAILDVLSQTFQHGFFQGLPELFFDYALLWRPNTPVIRRSDAKNHATTFPSWSWVGWQGNIVISCLKISHQLALEKKDSPPPLISIHPIVSWYKTNSRTGMKELINNNYNYGESYQEDPSVVLPSHWSRVESVQPEDNTQCRFCHDDIPGIEFARPVPIRSEEVTNPLDSWTSELSFQSHRAFLFTGSILGAAHHRQAWSNVAMKMTPYCLSCTLIDSESNWAGMLYLNTSNKGDFVTGEKCEIILISRGIAQVGKNQEAKIWLEEWKYVDKIKNLAVYEYYNVLCVERKNGCTYRAAIGRVWRESWHKQCLEKVEINLS